MTRILYVAAYAEPEPVGANRTLVATALAMRAHGHSGEFLTWPNNPSWRGPLPDESDERLEGVPYIRHERAGLIFHVVAPPWIWAERVLTEAEWDEAVDWARRVLLRLKPEMVHQQHWQWHSFILQAATELGIPTVYSLNDYGLGCLRTILVTGNDKLCDTRADVEKCGRCVLSGRNLLGKANEYLAMLPPCETLLARAYGRDGSSWLAKHGAVRMSVRRRAGLNIERCRRIISKVQAVVAASPFALDFFRQFGLSEDRGHVRPWFHEHTSFCPETTPAPDGGLRLAFVGRISPEKGPHILLHALSRLDSSRPIRLRMVGALDSAYALDLRKRFPERAGSHCVEWTGWIPNQALPEFYHEMDAVVLPSLWYDNTPLALVEALAQGKPVICTDVPSMTHLVQNEVNGLVFPLGDSAALTACLRRLTEDPNLSTRLAARTRNVEHVSAYAKWLDSVYSKVLGAAKEAAKAGSNA